MLHLMNAKNSSMNLVTGQPLWSTHWYVIITFACTFDITLLFSNAKKPVHIIIADMGFPLVPSRCRDWAWHYMLLYIIHSPVERGKPQPNIGLPNWERYFTLWPKLVPSYFPPPTYWALGGPLIPPLVTAWVSPCSCLHNAFLLCHTDAQTRGGEGDIVTSDSCHYSQQLLMVDSSCICHVTGSVKINLCR